MRFTKAPRSLPWSERPVFEGLVLRTAQAALLAVGFVCLASAPAFATEPLDEIKAFSALDEINLLELADGDVMLKPGERTDFQRGISAESCFIVKAPVKKTAALYQRWDATGHPALNLRQHCPVQSPAKDKDFAALDLSGTKSPIRWLVDHTEETRPEETKLQLSHAEAARISDTMKKGGNPAETAAQCWRDILKARALTFQSSGWDGMPPYETVETPISVSSEIRNLVKMSPRIAAQFSALLEKTVLAKGAGSAGLNPTYYWELLDINNHATLNLGATYSRTVGDECQILDCVYYSSDDTYASFSLRQIWPIRIQDKPASLVWQGDFISAPSLGGTQGIERMAAGGMLRQGLREAIRAFQGDALAEEREPAKRQ